MKKQNRALSVVLSAVMALSAVGMMLFVVSAENTPVVPSVNPPAVTDFTDGFEGDTLSDAWTVVYEQIVNSSDSSQYDRYYVKDGQFAATTSFWNSLTKFKMYTGDASLMDCVVEASLKPGGTDPISCGLFVRASELGVKRDAYKGYYVAIDADKRSYVVDGTNGKYSELPIQIDVYKNDGGTKPELIKSFDVDGKHFVKGAEYMLKVVACGNTMKIYLDGKLVGQVYDDTYKNGYAEIYTLRTVIFSDYFTLRGLTWDDPFTLARTAGILTDDVNITSFLRADVAIVSKNALSATLKGQSMTLAERLIADGAFTMDDYKKVFSGSTGASGNQTLEKEYLPVSSYPEPAVISFVSLEQLEANSVLSFDGTSSYEFTEGALKLSCTAPKSAWQGQYRVLLCKQSGRRL